MEAEIESRLAQLLNDTPEPDQQAAMLECVRLANGYLSVDPSRDSPEEFSSDLMSDQGIKRLVQKAEAQGFNPGSAESPSELILGLLPSDGHLE